VAKVIQNRKRKSSRNSGEEVRKDNSVDGVGVEELKSAGRTTHEEAPYRWRRNVENTTVFKPGKKINTVIIKSKVK